MQVFILAVAIAAVLGADPRCLDQNEHGYAVHIAHSTDCRKFYKCDEDYELSEEICPGNLEYNPVLQVCDYPRGFCGISFRTSIQSVLNCSVLPHGAFLPDYSDGCKSFFYCVNGIAKTSHCRNGTKFDQDRGFCAAESQVECDSSKVLEFRTNKPKNEENQPTILSRSADTNSEEPHKYPNFKNGCKSFLECNEGDCVEVNCPEGYIFDMMKETCEERENAFCDNIDSHPAIESRGPEPSCVVEHGRWYPDNDNCHMFYVCSGGKAYHQKCHNGQYFDRTKRACLKGDCPYFPGPGPDECDSTKDLFLPDDTDCTKFYICINNKKVHQQCGDHQMYDKIAKYCRKDDKGECYTGGDPGSCDGHPSGTNLPNPADCTKFFLCLNGKKISQQCSAGQRFDSVRGYCVRDTTGICIPVGPTTECDKSCDGEPEGTKRVDPSNCAGFKLCIDREWRTQSCNGGYYFNPHKLQCVLDDGSCDQVKPTLKPTTPPPELPCDGKPHGTYEPILTDCTKFRLCLSGNWRYLTCDPGYYFNKDELVCKLDDGTCDTVLPLPSTTPCEPIKCKDGTLKPHIDCKKYRMCVNGDWIEQECNKGQMFDPVLNHCVRDPFDGTCRPKPTDCDGYLDGSFKENEADCTGFFVCVRGTWIPQTCTPDKYFDKDLKYCIPDPHDGTCRPAPTPDPTLCDGKPHGTTKEKPGDCTGFLVCVLGSWIPQTCDPDKYFDPHLNYCIPDPLDGTCRPPLKKDCDGFPHGSQKENKGDCTGFFVCVLGKWIPQTCGKDKYYNKHLKYCVEDPLDGTCRPNPTPKDCNGHPHGSFKENTRDCTGFFICTLGTWVEQSCGPDKYYSPALQYCVPDPHDGTCRPSTTTDCDKTCDGMAEGTKKIQSDNCAGFLLCVDGSWRVQSCDRGYWFNPNKLLCELDLLNKCDKTLPTLPPTKPPVEESCGTSLHGTFKPDFEDCTSFYLCLFGDWRHLTCDPGYYFNKKLLVCVLNNGDCETALPLPTPTPCHSNCDGYSHGSFKPYENDCHKFYVCVKGKWRPQTCRDGFYFDEVNHYCRKDENNICPGQGTPEDCGIHKEGEYIAHADCKKFYICVKGTLLEYNCGTNQYFDKNLKYCRAGSCPENDCDGHPDGTYLQHEDPNECDKFYICFNGKKVLNQCGTGFYYDTKNKYCRQDVSGVCHPPTPSLDCTGTPDGTYLPHEDPNECDKFYICFNGKKVLNQCGTGFYYDTKNKYCRQDVSGVCHPPTPSLDCTGTPDGTYLPHEDPNECDKFYICFNGKKVLNQCGTGFYYDTKDKYCRQDVSGVCHPPTPSLDCTGTPDGTYLPHEDPNECDKFYICFNGKKVLNQCGTGFYYDTKDKYCRQDVSGVCHPPTPSLDCTGTPDGTYLPHEDPNECDKFYICFNKKKVLNQCGTGFYYDTKDKYCRQDVSGVCHPPTPSLDCTGTPDGTYLPHEDPNECDKFYICFNKKKVLNQCGTGFYYDTKDKYCRQDVSGVCHPPTPSLDCTGTPDGTYLPHEDPNECDKFYICFNKKKVLNQCGTGFYYDTKDKYCRQDVSGVCHPPTPSLDCTGTPDGTYLPHEDRNECDKFYICFNKKKVLNQCGTGFYYNRANQACVAGICPYSGINTCASQPDGTTLKDKSDCAGFIVCYKNIEKPQKCAPLRKFDVGKGYCVKNDGSCIPGTPLSLSIFNCKGKLDGTVFQHPQCNKFYLCKNEKLIISDCAESYFFDANLGRCRINDGSCREAGIEKVCVGKGSSLLKHYKCTKFFKCENDQAVEKTCPANNFFDSKKRVCRFNNGECKDTRSFRTSVSDINECTGRPDGVTIPDNDDCSIYYMCTRGKLVRQFCGKDHRFDQQLGRCVQDSGSCLLLSKITTYINATCVDREDGTYLPDFDACNQFYICLNNFSVPQECPGNYMFDQTTSTCVPNDGRCPLANVMPIENDISNVDCEGKHGVFVPDLTNCEQFYTCLYGKPQAFRCSNGQYFDAIKGICTPNNGECAQKSLTTGDICEGLKDGSLVSHETDCTMFYICTNGQPKETICDQGYFFDSIAKECRMDNGTCRDVRSRSNGVCYGKHGTLIGHPDCQKYYICLNGQPLLSQCLKGYYFDTKAGTCKNDLYGLCEPKNIAIYEPTKEVSCIGKTENRFYANIQDNCRTFYTCVKGEPKIESCPAGLLYNAILNTCDWPGFVKCIKDRMPRAEEKTCVGAVDGVRYPNIKTGCKSFIHCVNGVAQESYCSDGLLFNSKKNVCDWPKSVTCKGYGYQENTFSAVKLYN